MTPGPTPLQAANLLLLAVFALLLLAGLVGIGRPPVWTLAAVLALRLMIQLLRARSEPALRRPAAWLLDAVLLALLITQARG